jgi:hypothetical protein
MNLLINVKYYDFLVQNRSNTFPPAKYCSPCTRQLGLGLAMQPFYLPLNVLTIGLVVEHVCVRVSNKHPRGGHTYSTQCRRLTQNRNPNLSTPKTEPPLFPSLPVDDGGQTVEGTLRACQCGIGGTLVAFLVGE